jgi:hypothetical protein
MTEKTMVEKAWERVNRCFAGDSSITMDQLAYAWGFIEGQESRDGEMAELEEENRRIKNVYVSPLTLSETIRSYEQKIQSLHEAGDKMSAFLQFPGYQESAGEVNERRELRANWETVSKEGK